MWFWTLSLGFESKKWEFSTKVLSRISSKLTEQINFLLLGLKIFYGHEKIQEWLYLKKRWLSCQKLRSVKINPKENAANDSMSSYWDFNDRMSPIKTVLETKEGGGDDALDSSSPDSHMFTHFPSPSKVTQTKPW